MTYRRRTIADAQMDRLAIRVRDGSHANLVILLAADDCAQATGEQQQTGSQKSHEFVSSGMGLAAVYGYMRTPVSQGGRQAAGVGMRLFHPGTAPRNCKQDNFLRTLLGRNRDDLA